MDKKGNGMFFIGGTGYGKTAGILEKMDKKRNYVFDVQAQFQQFNCWNDIYDLDGFVSHIAKSRETSGYKNTDIVIEESTRFFSNRGYHKELQQCCVSKRHTNNNFLFAYHSLNAIPSYLYDFIDIIYLYYTNDNPIKIAKKMEFIENLDLYVKAMSKINDKGKKYAWGKYVEIKILR